MSYINNVIAICIVNLLSIAKIKTPIDKINVTTLIIFSLKCIYNLCIYGPNFMSYI